jgi:hypothetical protein
MSFWNVFQWKLFYASWDAHVEFVSKKIIRKLAVLERVSYFMPSNALLKVYNSIISPHFNYCCTVWSNVKNQFYLEKVLKLQKRAAKILLNNRDIRTPTSFLFSSSNWMPIRDFYMYRKVVFLHPNVKLFKCVSFYSRCLLSANQVKRFYIEYTLCTKG